MSNYNLFAIESERMDEHTNEQEQERTTDAIFGSFYPKNDYDDGDTVMIGGMETVCDDVSFVVLQTKSSWENRPKTTARVAFLELINQTARSAVYRRAEDLAELVCHRIKARAVADVIKTGRAIVRPQTAEMFCGVFAGVRDREEYLINVDDAKLIKLLDNVASMLNVPIFSINDRAPIESIVLKCSCRDFDKKIIETIEEYLAIASVAKRREVCYCAMIDYIEGLITAVNDGSGVVEV